MLDLFAGIGGFSLAGHWAGWQTAAFVEWDKFCQKVLAKNFPNVPIYGDIKDFHYEQEREKIGPIDLVCGGFPCQPFSHAGKRNGTADNRYLWPEMLQVIGEVKPAWVVGENVAGLLSMDGGAVFESVCASLEAEGYAVEAFVLPAISRGAPHRRDRVWIVAYSPQRTDRGRTGQISSQNGRQERDNISTDQVHGFTADASSSRTWLQNRESESGGQRRESGKNSQSQMVRPGNGEVNAERIESCDRNLTNSTSQGLQERGQSGIRELQEERGEGVHHRSELKDSQSISNPHKQGLAEREGERSYDAEEQSPPFGTDWSEHWNEAATRLCGMDARLSRGLDRNKRLKALGNAIVPQIAFEIFKAINETNI